MSIDTDWLIAAAADAEAVASIVTTEERTFEDWPSLTLEGIGELELQHLFSVLRGDGEDDRSTLGDLLYQESEEGPFVAALDPAFVSALAALSAERVSSVARAWQRAEHLHALPVRDLEVLLQKMASFARQAEETRAPILQLMTL